MIQFDEHIFEMGGSTTNYQLMVIIDGLGWWFGYLRFPYARDCCLGAPRFESQTTNHCLISLQKAMGGIQAGGGGSAKNLAYGFPKLQGFHVTPLDSSHCGIHDIHGTNGIFTYYMNG